MFPCLSVSPPGGGSMVFTGFSVLRSGATSGGRRFSTSFSMSVAVPVASCFLFVVEAPLFCDLVMGRGYREGILGRGVCCGACGSGRFGQVRGISL